MIFGSFALACLFVSCFSLAACTVDRADPTAIALFESSNIACFRIPAVATDGAGTVVVAVEQRFSGRPTTFEEYQTLAAAGRHDVAVRCSDAGFINIVGRRSADGGKSWEAMQLIVDYRQFLTDGYRVALAGNPTLVWVAARRRFLLLFAMTRSRGEDNSAPCVWENTRDHPRCRDLPADHGIWMTESLDGGRTWADPQPIAAGRDPEIVLRRPGPGHGIVLNSGRIVVPAYPNLLLSDDAGVSWRHGAAGPGNETAVAELDDGTVWASIRAGPAVVRRLGAVADTPVPRLGAYSTDGGETYASVAPDDRFPVPEVHAALLRVDRAEPQDDMLLMSFPSPPRIAIPRDITRDRRRLLLAVGDGMGRSFQAHFVHEGLAGYSDLVAIGRDAIAVVYEGRIDTRWPFDPRAYNAHVIWKPIDSREFAPCSDATGCFVLGSPLPGDLYAIPLQELT